MTPFGRAIDTIADDVRYDCNGWLRLLPPSPIVRAMPR